MSLKALRVVADLRDTLPVRVGERWPEIADEVNGLLDQLAAAGDAVERQVLIDKLIALLDPFPLAQAHVQDAFSTSGGTRRRVRGGSYRRRMSDEGASAKTLERTPHLDVDDADAIRPGTTFTARVHANTQGFAPGESGVAFALPDREELALQVWIVTSIHFEVLGEDSGVMIIRREADESSTVVFTLRATRATAESEESGITALFAFEGRPAGSVHRLLRVAPEAQTTVSEPRETASTPPPALMVDPEALRPDLTVNIERVPGGGDQQFSCRVSTPLLDEYADGVTEQWDLPGRTDSIVRNYMAGFTNPLAEEAARRAALVGAGRQLFRASPPVFQRAYWALVEGAQPIRSIYIVSAEPFVPWELMIPHRDGEERSALGVEHGVGRWIHAQHVSPPQRMRIEDSYVIAPRYRGTKTLSFSAAEAEFVCDAFSGQEIRPALFASIESVLGGGGATLLHLICHGTAAEDGSQAIELDPDEVLNDYTLEGMPGLRSAVAAKRPFVFINACEVGRPSPALVGTGGFASAFITLGARCVIAPIWSVKDSVAGRAAREFYGQVRDHPERPFADILRDLRRRAYEDAEPEDSWAAYCFYGDPLAAHETA
jgi:CHAT domain